MAAASVVIPARRSSATNRSWSVPPQSIDPPLGLEAQGVDGFDPERGERTAHLGRVLALPELFLPGPGGIVPPEDAEAVPGEGYQDPAGLDQGLQEAEVAPGNVRRHEGGPGKEPARGIVRRGDQITAGPPPLQPGVRAPVPEDKQSRLGLARAGHASRPQETVHAHAAHREPVRLEFRGEGRGVQPRVRRSGQGEVLPLCGRGEPPPLGPDPVPVHRGLAAILAESSREPPDLAQIQPGTRGRLGADELTLRCQAERVIPMQITVTHEYRRWVRGHRPSLLSGRA